MMIAHLSPAKLEGRVTPPPSKSYAHRALICAALSNSTSKIENIALSEDINATIDCLRTIGADIQIDGKTAIVDGIKNIPESAVLDCRESGSTLRFMIPVCAALGIKTKFIGSGKLPSRPIETYKRELSKHGINFTFSSDLSLPLEISGKLRAGEFAVEGDISSQYITGLMFALPITGGSINITSNLESKGYVDMTADILGEFGVTVKAKENIFKTHGKFKSKDYTVENDWSQAAFWYATERVIVEGMTPRSKQADKQCAVLLTEIKYKKSEEIDVSQIPDLLPILAASAAMYECKVIFTNAKRLVLKESNRLKTTAEMINALGGNAVYSDDSLTVIPVGRLRGGKVDGANDHRIVMAAAIAAAKCRKGVVITDAQAIKKSYPDFWDVYKNLGGKVTFE
jgi:3-phosphoshikimate 1-carboxyvinyltransferase